MKTAITSTCENIYLIVGTYLKKPYVGSLVCWKITFQHDTRMKESSFVDKIMQDVRFKLGK